MPSGHVDMRTVLSALRVSDRTRGILSMSERAERVGAGIFVESHVGGGTRFTLRVPR